MAGVVLCTVTRVGLLGGLLRISRVCGGVVGGVVGGVEATVAIVNFRS